LIFRFGDELFSYSGFIVLKCLFVSKAKSETNTL